MNAPRDPWDDFAEVFADVLSLPLSDEDIERLREEYEREQIESALSEAAEQANIRRFNRE